MPSHPKRDRRGPRNSPFPDEFVARVASASAAYMDSGDDQLEEATRRSAVVLGEVFDACNTREALDDLNRLSNGAFTVWIPDAAMDLSHFGRASEGVTLLARLCRTLGYEPFSPELIAGMMKGMRRWCSRGGEFEIDLLPEPLGRLIALLLSECTTPARMDELGAVLGRSVWDWRDQAVENLRDAGVEPSVR
jgi:hypothetical protein